MMINAPIRAPQRDDTPSAAARDPSDQVLLERFRAQGDEAAFANLVERYGKTVWGVCWRVLRHEQDVEDAFQAVFLVLARKAASIRSGEAVGSWLYGVAHRTAMKARRSAARRHNYEKQAVRSAGQDAEPWAEEGSRELQRLLDAEVQRLPEKYRAPFVLCCLEGMSRNEAARELKWKEGTLSGRLAEARKLLQDRLARRGVMLSAALTATALAENAAFAAAQPVLVPATITSGLAMLAGTKTTGVSVSALQLAQAISRTIRPARLKTILAVILSLAVLIAGVSLAALQLAGDEMSDPDTFVGPPVPLGTPVDEQVFALALSPDGKKLVTGGGRQVLPGQLQIWDTNIRENLVTMRGIPGVRALAYSPGGTSFATGDFSGQIKLRAAVTGRELAAVQAHDTGVNSLAFSPDGDFLASAGADRTLKLWEAKGLRELRVFHGHESMVLSVAFFHHAPSFVSAGHDRTAIIWDTTSGEPRFMLKGHADAIESVAVSPDDKLIVTSSRDRKIKLWDAATGKEKAILEDIGTIANAVAFSPDGKLLASAGFDGKVRLFDVKSGKSAGVIGQHAGPVRALDFSRDGKLLASGGSDRTAKLWRLSGGNEPGVFTTQSPVIRPIQAVAYAPDGTHLAMATTDGAVQIRDAGTGDVLKLLSGHGGSVNSLAFSADGRLLASGSSDKTVRLWNLASGQAKQTLHGHVDEVYAVAFMPDGTRLASAGRDKVIRIWDAASGKPLAALPGHEKAIRALAVTRDGRNLVSGSEDRSIKIWDVADIHARGAKVPSNAPVTLKGHTGAVRALVVALDGRLASASDDGTVKLWDLTQGSERLTLRGHTAGVLSLALTPTGRTLVSGSRDRTVRVWDMAGGDLRAILRRHQSAVTAVAVHPRGKDLLSGGLDTWLLRWPGAKKKARPVGSGGAGAPVAMPPPPPSDTSAPVAELLEDNTGFLVANLTNVGTLDASVADRDEQTHFSGTCSLAVTEFQRFNPRLPQWRYRIAENPGPGQFRFVRFAWKRTEAPGIMLQFHAMGNKWHRYFAGRVSAATQAWGVMTRVADEPPRAWELVTRDLFNDFGPMTITGIGFSALEGPGHAYFDHIYLGRTVADLDQVTDRLKDVQDLADEDNSMSWIRGAGAGLALLGLLSGIWLYLRRGKVVLTGTETTSSTAASSASAAFPCPHCSKKLKARPDLAGKRVKCPACGRQVPVPQAEVRSPGQRLPQGLWLSALFALPVLALAGGLWLAFGLGERAPDTPEAMQEYYQSFQGNPAKSTRWEWLGQNAEERVRLEPEGLRITLPKGFPGKGPEYGLSTQIAVRGDFEITAGFEIIKEPARQDAGGSGTKLHLLAFLDTPNWNIAGLCREVTPWGGGQVSPWLLLRNSESSKPDMKFQAFSTDIKSGRLRLVRTGSAVASYIAEGPDGKFVRVYEYPFSAEDLKEVRLVAHTGGPKASFDVRIRDLRIRAASLPDMDAGSEEAGWQLWLTLGIVIAILVGITLVLRRRGRGTGREPRSSVAGPV